MSYAEDIRPATLHGYLNAAGIPKGMLADRVLALVTGSIPKNEIIDAAGIRELAGVKNRRTLQAWREKGFPQPFAEMSGHIELFDAREVRQWLAEHRPDSAQSGGDEHARG